MLLPLIRYQEAWDTKKAFVVWFPVSVIDATFQRAAFYYPDSAASDDASIIYLELIAET